MDTRASVPADEQVRPGVVSVVAGVCLGASLTAHLVGATPWPALVLPVVLLVLGLGQRLPWASAAALGVVAPLTAAAFLGRWSDAWGLGLDVTSAVFLALTGLVGLVLAHRGGWRLPAWGRAAPLVPGVVLAVGTGVALLVAVGHRHVGWLMANDAAYSTFAARTILDAGGVDENSATGNPLPYLLQAVAASGGRAEVAPGDLLAHDVQLFAGTWVVLSVLAAVLAAVVVVRTVPSRGVAAWAGVVASASVFTWFNFGVAAQHGFWNVPLTWVLMLACWLLWLDQERTPLVALVGLGAATVCMLAAWAPLATAPVALAAGLVLTRLREWFTGPGAGRHALVLVAALLPVVAYLLLATLPDLSRWGYVLGLEGAAPRNPFGLALLLPVVVVVIGLVQSGTSGSRVQGVQWLLIGWAVGTAYLMWQRAGLETLWGYYPVKNWWIFASLWLVILIAELGRLAAGRAWRVAVGCVLVPALPLALMAQVAVPRMPVSGVPGGAVLTPIGVLTQPVGGAQRLRTEHLLELAVPDRAVMVVEYADPVSDRFLNLWLMQALAADVLFNQYARDMDPRDVGQACDAAKIGPRPLTVLTSSQTVADELAACTGPDVVVELRERPTLAGGQDPRPL